MFLFYKMKLKTIITDNVIEIEIVFALLQSKSGHLFYKKLKLKSKQKHFYFFRFIHLKSK